MSDPSYDLPDLADCPHAEQWLAIGGAAMQKCPLCAAGVELGAKLERPNWVVGAPKPAGFAELLPPKRRRGYVHPYPWMR